MLWFALQNWDEGQDDMEEREEDDDEKRNCITS